VLPQDLARDQEFLERFRREARTASRLTHPNIVAAVDVGFADGFHYIAMEYIDGPNLEKVLEKQRKLPPPILLKVAMDIACALEGAEGAGIVHRDLKPGNILLNSQGVAKLTDLGLSSASAGDQRVTMAGFAVGTPYYISPEQARGDRDVDCRADIYGFGATLYHLATGVLPFPGTNPVIIMTQHLQETPPAPHERDPSLPLPISALITKMMAKEPAKRHQNARELKADIERVMRGKMPAPAAAATSKTGTASTAPTNKTPRPPSEPFLNRMLAGLDKLLPFVPADLRLPCAAGAATAVFIGLLWLLVWLLKR
jgi:serine/threonine protein kinase